MSGAARARPLRWIRDGSRGRARKRLAGRVTAPWCPGSRQAGRHLIAMLAEDGAKVVVSDLDLRAVQAAGKSALAAEVVAAVLAHELDMYASCAMGGARTSMRWLTCGRRLSGVRRCRVSTRRGSCGHPVGAGSTQASDSRRATRRLRLTFEPGDPHVVMPECEVGRKSERRSP